MFFYFKNFLKIKNYPSLFGEGAVEQALTHILPSIVYCLPVGGSSDTNEP